MRLAEALSTAALRCAMISARVPTSILASCADATASPASASLELGHQFRIVDLEQQLPGGDVVAALNRALSDPAVDARRDVDAGGVGLALDDERLRLDQVPQREADSRGDDERDDDSRRSCDLWRALRDAPLAVRRGRGRRGRGRLIGVRRRTCTVGASRIRCRCLLVVGIHLDPSLNCPSSRIAVAKREACVQIQQRSTPNLRCLRRAANSSAKF